MVILEVILCLLTFVTGSSLGFRMIEFAVPLLLITYFSDTLLPNAIYGFTSCGTFNGISS